MAPASRFSPEEVRHASPTLPKGPTVTDSPETPFTGVSRRDTSRHSILPPLTLRGVLFSFERAEMHKCQSADLGTGGPGLSRRGAQGPPFSRMTALPTLTERLRTLPRSRAQGHDTADEESAK